jgi:hypothetical protein
MVLPFDVNNKNAGGIHYYNKLHPGMRMARPCFLRARVRAFAL